MNDLACTISLTHEQAHAAARAIDGAMDDIARRCADDLARAAPGILALSNSDIGDIFDAHYAAWTPLCATRDLILKITGGVDRRRFADDCAALMPPMRQVADERVAEEMRRLREEALAYLLSRAPART